MNDINLNVALLTSAPDTTAPNPPFLPCTGAGKPDAEGAGYYYYFDGGDVETVSPGGYRWPRKSEPGNDSIKIRLGNPSDPENKTDEYFDMDEPTITQVGTEPPLVTVKTQNKKFCILDNENTEPASGQFNINVTQVKDGSGSTLPNPKGGIGCDPRWDND